MKFLVTYQMPHSGLDTWMQLPEAARKEQEEQMKAQWNAWMEEHKDAIVETSGVGKPKRITQDGIEDARNDIMMYSLVEAGSLEAATAMFTDHPHFGIEGSWIEVMSANPIN